MKKITNADNLDLDYGLLMRKVIADQVMQQLEDTIEYFEGDLTKVLINPIPNPSTTYFFPPADNPVISNLLMNFNRL